MNFEEKIVAYKTEFAAEIGIKIMAKDEWYVVERNRLNKNVTLGCTGCFILPLPIFWFSRKFGFDDSNNDVEKIKYRRELRLGDDDYIPPVQEINNTKNR